LPRFLQCGINVEKNMNVVFLVFASKHECCMHLMSPPAYNKQGRNQGGNVLDIV